MAFQLSKLAARVSLSHHSVFILENKLPRTRNFSNTFANYWRSFHSGGEGSLNNNNITRGLISSPRVINTLTRAKKFSTTTSAASQSFEWPGLKAWKRGAKVSRPAAVLVGLSAAVVASCVHSSALCAMAAQAGVDSDLDLDSEGTDWKKAKQWLLTLSLEEKRKKYKTSHIPLEGVPVWESGASSAKPLSDVNEELNQKISLFRGDITKLEIDAIANAANKTLLGGGGVDGAIHRGAGPLLKKECSTLGGCETGQAKITGAYSLPAKYVIHTVGPIVFGSVSDKERNALRDCYKNCLHTATENKLRTVAFPCISTGVYGYPPEQAVEVALKTVREYLEEHPAEMDRVIFCVFLKSDEELYKDRLPAYFPKAG